MIQSVHIIFATIYSVPLCGFSILVPGRTKHILFHEGLRDKTTHSPPKVVLFKISKGIEIKQSRPMMP